MVSARMWFSPQEIEAILSGNFEEPVVCNEVGNHWISTVGEKKKSPSVPSCQASQGKLLYIAINVHHNRTLKLPHERNSPCTLRAQPKLSPATTQTARKPSNTSVAITPNSDSTTAYRSSPDFFPAALSVSDFGFLPSAPLSLTPADHI